MIPLSLLERWLVNMAPTFMAGQLYVVIVCYQNSEMLCMPLVNRLGWLQLTVIACFWMCIVCVCVCVCVCV